jgi:hypothetical protein
VWQPPELASGHGLDAELFPQLPLQAGSDALAGLRLAAGELPLAGMAIARPPLAKEHATVADDDAGGDAHDDAPALSSAA